MTILQPQSPLNGKNGASGPSAFPHVARGQKLGPEHAVHQLLKASRSVLGILQQRMNIAAQIIAQVNSEQLHLKGWRAWKSILLVQRRNVMMCNYEKLSYHPWQIYPCVEPQPAPVEVKFSSTVDLSATPQLETTPLEPGTSTLPTSSVGC